MLFPQPSPTGEKMLPKQKPQIPSNQQALRGIGLCLSVQRHFKELHELRYQPRAESAYSLHINFNQGIHE